MSDYKELSSLAAFMAISTAVFITIGLIFFFKLTIIILLSLFILAMVISIYEHFILKHMKTSIQEHLKKLTQEQREEIASRMYNPIRCGGAGYDENGKYYLIIGGKRRNAKEINQIIREMNPKWSDEALAPYFLDEGK